jgi:hypothetical protein
MNATENVWRQLARTSTAAEFRAEVAPHLRLMLRRAADGGPGPVTERLRATRSGAGRPSEDESIHRLATALRERLLGPDRPLVTRDTVLLAETLAG